MQNANMCLIKYNPSRVEIPKQEYFPRVLPKQEHVGVSVKALYQMVYVTRHQQAD